MLKEEFDGYKYIEGGVCAARGFTANGLNCGINPVKEKNDLGIVYSEVPCNTAAVYTQNKVKGAPVIVTQKHLEKSHGISKQLLLILKMPIHVTLVEKRLRKKQAGLWQMNLV